MRRGACGPLVAVAGYRGPVGRWDTRGPVLRFTVDDWAVSWRDQLAGLVIRNQVAPTEWSLRRERELRDMVRGFYDGAEAERTAST